MLIALLPVDTTGLPRIPGVSIPKPSIEHTLITCDCGRECWIGPKQLVAHRIQQVPAACYFCVVVSMAANPGADFQVTALNEHADDIPRRT